MATNHYDMCRLCSSCVDVSWNIFDKDTSTCEIEFSVILRRCFDILVKVNETLPTKVCGSCHDTVLKFYEFWKRCRHNESIWKRKGPPILKDDIHSDYCKLKGTPDVLMKIEADWTEGLYEGTQTIMRANLEIDDHVPWRLEEDVLEENAVMKMNCISIAGVENVTNHCEASNIFQEVPENSVHGSSTNMLESMTEDLRQEEVAVKKSVLSFSADSSSELFIGKISKDSGGLWKCNICNKKSEIFGVIKSHVIEHFPTLSCVECGKSFSRRSIWKRHMRKHNSLTFSLGYTCTDCGKIFQLKHLLNKHITIEHETSVTRSGEFDVSCGLCSRTFYSSIEMEEHNESCAEDCDDSTSDVSDASPSGDNMSTGDCTPVITSNENNISSGACVPVTTCNEQSVELSGNSSTKKKEKRFFSCHLCYLRFRTTRTLIGHMKKVHNCEKPFKCEFPGCGVLWRDRLSFRNHQKKHNRKYKCELCPVACRDKRDLEDHMNLHNNLRPHKCELCGASYMRKHHLREHILKHENVKPFTCDDCGISFRKKYLFERHRRIKHVAEKLFICEMCGERYKSSTSLRTHLKRKHTN